MIYMEAKGKGNGVVLQRYACNSITDESEFCRTILRHIEVGDLVEITKTKCVTDPCSKVRTPDTASRG